MNNTYDYDNPKAIAYYINDLTGEGTVMAIYDDYNANIRRATKLAKTVFPLAVFKDDSYYYDKNIVVTIGFRRFVYRPLKKNEIKTLMKYKDESMFDYENGKVVKPPKLKLNKKGVYYTL